MEKARLFVGSFLNSDSARLVSQIYDANPELSRLWDLKARFVPLPKLHLTWLFIGDVERTKVEELKSDLKRCMHDFGEMQNEIDLKDSQQKNFSITYDRVEVWPNLKQPRVLVLESTTESPLIESLHAVISRTLSKYLQKDDSVQRFKKFRPHLTVCRFSIDHKLHARGIHRSIDDFQIPEGNFPLRHEISNISLIESDLNAGPNGYSSILDLKL